MLNEGRSFIESPHDVRSRFKDSIKEWFTVRRKPQGANIHSADNVIIGVLLDPLPPSTLKFPTPNTGQRNQRSDPTKQNLE